MRKTLIILGTLLVAILLVLGACAPTSAPVTVPRPTPAPTPSPSAEYENVAAVVAALDKHTMSIWNKPHYELIGAYDGMKYDVEPGGYRLEIYVYRALEKMAEMALQAQTVDNQVYIDINAMLLLHTTNKDDLDRLVADLHDGQWETKSDWGKESSTPPQPASTPAPAPTKVVTIDIGWPIPKNWDADPEIDGIEFDLTPKDAEDRKVETPGVVSAKLWLERSFFEGGGKGDLVQEWNDIQVTKDDYHWLTGVTTRLEYKGFQPKELQFGILEVTLVTPDGKSFTDRDTSVMLGE